MKPEFEARVEYSDTRVIPHPRVSNTGIWHGSTQTALLAWWIIGINQQRPGDLTGWQGIDQTAKDHDYEHRKVTT